jgi:hypothetical protein
VIVEAAAPAPVRRATAPAAPRPRSITVIRGTDVSTVKDRS